MTLESSRTTIGGGRTNDATRWQGWLAVGGGGRPSLNNDEATFEGGRVGSKTSLMWMRRSLLGETEASGYGPSEPQFAAVLVVPPPPPRPTADEEGGERGERRFSDTMANTVELIFLRHGRDLFLCHRGGDGQMMQGGSDGDGCWFGFDDRIANFEVRYAGRRHGKDGALARGSDACPLPSQQGGGGGGGVGTEAMRRPAGTTSQKMGSAMRGDSMTSRCDERPRGGRNKRARGRAGAMRSREASNERMTRGDATSSRGDEMTRRVRNKRC